MILHAPHDQDAGGLAVTHIVTAGVGADHHLVVFDIVGAFGIAPAILCGLCLIQHASHLPGADHGLVVVVVGVQVYIITGDICGGNEEYHLLAVCRLGVLDLLCDAGCQNRAFRLEHGVVGVFACLHIVTGQLAHIIREGVANCLAQSFHILGVKLTGIFQGADHLVVAVGVVDRVAHLVTGACAVQTVLQEVLRAVFHGQLFCEILHQKGHHCAAVVLCGQQVVHHIQTVHIAQHIGGAEGIRVITVAAEVIVGDGLHQLIQCAGEAVVIRTAQQVHQVACPACHVCVILAVFVGVGNIHRAEHVTKIHIVTVGQIHIFNVLQGRKLCCTTEACNEVGVHIQHIFHHIHKFPEGGILVACHNAPGAGVIAVHAGTDVLDHQGQRIGIRCRLCNISTCQLLQNCQVHQEGVVVADGACAQCRDLHIGGVAAAGTLFISFPAGPCSGRCLGIHIFNVVTDGGQYLRLDQGNAAAGTNTVGSKAVGETASLQAFFLLGIVAQLVYIGIYVAVTAQGTGVGGIALLGTSRVGNHRFVIVGAGFGGKGLHRQDRAH